MSSAGHVLDMIARIKKNRDLKQKTVNRYSIVKDAYKKHSSSHRTFHDRNKLSSRELNELRTKIRTEIVKDQKRNLTRFLILLILLSLILTLGFYLILH
jgi:hypothetical protein